jgi:hypothetical protein
MNEWIKCSYRLPEYKQQVLFVNGKNQVSVGTRFPYQEGTDVFATEDGIYFNDDIQVEWAVCKYWMPLPKPPEE